MADTRTQRGPHPKDPACFGPDSLPVLEAAVEDLSWLLSRGYPHTAAGKLVGDRYTLRDRQRKALKRCAAGREACAQRRAKRVAPEKMAGEPLLIDGYNLLLTVEAALSGGVLLLGRDGALRDLTAMSRHYRQVLTSRPALERIGRYVAALRSGPVTWYLDRPISNSGRLRRLIEEVAGEEDWRWRVELVGNPDLILRDASDVVATADSDILDRCRRWLNLARLVVEESVPDAWILDFRSGGRGGQRPDAYGPSNEASADTG